MSTRTFQGKRIVLGVTGSIAAYKAVSLLRTLVQEGAEVSVVMTDSATQFVGPLTFEVLSGRQVLRDLFSHHEHMPHITLAESADLMVIAPATANAVAKCALGLADDLLSTMALAARCPLVLVPAMDGGMWDHPTVIDHVQVLRARGVQVMDPEEGLLASGQSGRGRFPSEDHIMNALIALLAPQRDWQGHRVLVSAGPTREAIDPVRYITNPSSGKMGYALAQAAMERGADVVLVSGPTTLTPPKDVEFHPIVTTEDMYEVLADKFSWATVLIMAAAPVDFRPRRPRQEKFKKRTWKGEALEIEPTPDILHTLSKQRSHQILVGFAAETHEVMKHGQAKLLGKDVDMIIANCVEGSDTAFGSDMNEVTILKRDRAPIQLARMSKDILAHRVLDEIRGLESTISNKISQPPKQVG